MHCFKFVLLVAVALPRPLKSQDALPGAVLNCCEGDIVVVLDASSSVAAYEFSLMVHFLADLLQPFQLGRGNVRVALLQVGTQPQMEFGLDTHVHQSTLQQAIHSTRQLHGDTNTAAAMRLALSLFGITSSRNHGPPKVLLWLTDGMEPGLMDEPIAELQQAGVHILAVSTGSSNYQVLRGIVTEPIEDHLHFVDVEDMSIITEDLRNAIIKIIRAERLQVRDVTSRSAILQWRPVLTAQSGSYDLLYGPSAGSGSNPGSPGGGPGTGTSTSHVPYIRRTLTGDARTAELTNLRPGTTYTATLRPESNQYLLKSLSVSFTTLPDIQEHLGPTTVSISESGPDRLRVTWGPAEPRRVHRYQVEYAILPAGQVRTTTVSGHESSTLLTQLQPGSNYLVTVSALYLTGQERAMSVKACTQEVLPPLLDLQLHSVNQNSVQVEWRGQGEGVQGYWVSWKGARGSYPYSSSSSSSSLYLPSSSVSTFLTNLVPNSRVCVSPVYKTARGEGLCCTHSQSESRS